MASGESWTVGRLLQWTTDYFQKNGADSPRLDAEILLAEAKGCQRIELYTSYEEIADEPLRARFRALVQRRAAGEPVAYLVGYREFYSMRFAVSPEVLIPRPETELLVMELLERAQQHTGAAPIEIADVGTGSGIIAVCAARHIANCRVTAIDSSAAALAIAQANATSLGVADRITFLEGDLLAPLPIDHQFHLIASNPPYVSEDEYADLPDDLRCYEPRRALVGGVGGSELVVRLIPQAADRLVAGGSLLVEISPMIERDVVEAFQSEPRFDGISVSKDLAGLSRVVRAKRK